MRSSRSTLLIVSLVIVLAVMSGGILLRVGGQHGAARRPLLAGADPQTRSQDLLAERSPGYAQFEAIDTDNRSPKQVAETIAKFCEYM